MTDLFADRAEAGRRVAALLPPLDPADTVVLALPRGGVPVAAEICRAQGLPLDLVFVRKIGAPGQPELAVGAVVDGTAPQIVVNEDVARLFGLDHAEVERMGRDKLPEIARRRELYLGGRAPLPLAGRTAVVVDDGVATGATLRAALAAVRAARPARVILALPTAPPGFLDEVSGEVDAIHCVIGDGQRGAVGAYYRSFPQVGDDEVAETVAGFRPDLDS